LGLLYPDETRRGEGASDERVDEEWELVVADAFEGMSVACVWVLSARPRAWECGR
jgi:hypothetical protein